jgi:hypothetical protein
MTKASPLAIARFIQPKAAMPIGLDQCAPCAEFMSDERPSGAVVSASEFSEPFDLLSELEANGEAHRGDKWMSVNKCPNFVRSSLDRVRARAMPPKPEVGLAIACCIHFGVRRFYGSPDIQDFMAERQRALTADDLDADDQEELLAWFRRCRLSVPDWSDSEFRQQNVLIVESTKKQLGHLAAEIGTSSSVLATFALMDALADQPGVLPAHRDAMRAAVEGFHARMRKRARQARRMVAMMLEGD